MPAEPLDTRVINGRFVGPDAPATGMLTIHDGAIVDEPDHAVWRTVNASGHVVFPGLIQAAPVTLDAALTKVRGGVTTAVTAGESSDEACLDTLQNVPDDLVIIQPAADGTLTDQQWELLLSDEPVHFQSTETSDFPVIHFLYHECHVKHTMSLERVAEVTSGNLARATGCFPAKGRFASGSDGDLFVFDPDSDDPYSDIHWPGRVIFSLLRGRILLFNGQIHTHAGDGRSIS